MHNVYLDESGYTGPDHLRDAQPVFVLASVGLSNDECRDLRARFFPTVKAKDLKHSDLAKHPQGQAGILQLLEHLSKRHNAAKFVVIHKRFALTCRMVDLLAEPLLKADGIDLYDRGGNIAMANMIHLVLPVFASPAYLESLLGRFQVLLRERDEAAYRAFFEPLHSPYPHDEIEKLLLPMRLYHERFGLEVIRGLPAGALDSALPSAIALAGYWRNVFNDWFDLHHDESDNMAKFEPIWKALTSTTIPDTLVGYDRRTIRYPLKVKQVHMTKSQSSYGVQIADVLAGAMERRARHLVNDLSRKDDEYGGRLVAFDGWLRFETLSMWPSADVKPEDLGTVGPNATDPNDFVGDLVKDVIDHDKKAG